MGSCVHHIPGRARFKLPQLRSDSSLLNHVKGHLMSLGGIRNIQANTKAGSFVVHYDVRKTSLKEIQDSLMAEGYLYRPQNGKAHKAPAKEMSPLVGQVSGAFGRAIFHALLERAITKGVGTILAR